MTDARLSAARPADPSCRIEAVFAEVARTRMAGLPLLNAALNVEAVDFGLWQDRWLGVLITPWCLNLVLLPAGGGNHPDLAPGDRCAVEFPAGVFEFVGGYHPRLGAYASCSLFSPVFEFPDQTAARLTARAARRALFEFGDVAGAQLPNAGGERQEAPLTRRAFLRGAFADER